MSTLNWRAWWTLSRLGTAALLSAHPLRSFIQVFSLALGIALGLAVHVIHESALSAFTSGVRQFSGTADRTIRGPKEGFDLSVVDSLLTQGGLSAVSPLIEMDVAIDGLAKPVKWLGIDFMRAAGVTPQFVGQSEAVDDFFDTQSVFLSPALLAQLQLSTGDAVYTLHGNSKLRWRIAGTLPQSAAGQLLAVSDIAAAQWRFDLGERIHRIDIKADNGVSNAQLDALLKPHLTALVYLDNPDDAGSRGAAVSRAYRVNLSILALVALLTGGFLVFSTQALAVVQRRRQWALMNALGASPHLIMSQILTESALTGAVGSVAGVLTGLGLAHFILQTVGADLGAGIFQGGHQALAVNAVQIAGFLALGIGCSMLGAWWPAREASRTPGVTALKSGTEEQALVIIKQPIWGLAGLALTPFCLLIPPVQQIPIGGYAAIACGLFGGIACMPALLGWLSRPPDFPHTIKDLAALKLAHSPGQTGIALSGIVASFSLVVAMAIMVDSFRHSLQDWLDQILPAPLYMRVQAGDTVSLDAKLRDQLSTVAGVAKAEYWMATPVVISADRNPPALVARPLDTQAIEQRLPLTDPPLTQWAPDHVPVWVSEPMVSLYGWTQGSTHTLPLPGFEHTAVQVAGIWRDYSRQQGAIVINQSDYQRITGDFRTTDAAFWNTASVSAAALTENLRAALADQPWGTRVEFVQSDFIRNISLQIFDRSFLVTYLLEAAAILIGLLGIATTFAATALSRKREFAALMAMGARKSELLRLLLGESLRVAAIGTAAGLALGAVFAAILVKIINPQSFHWSMDLHWPVLLLLGLGSVLMASATLTGALTAWAALRKSPLHVLKEDSA
jgi:putative ABC transport system permease protein